MIELINKIKRVFKCQSRRFEYELSKKISNNWFDHVRFKRSTGRKLNYKNPIYLNDKLFWLNKYWQSPLKIKCADKFLMHEYLKEKGLSHLSVPLLGVWKNADEIDFESLPNQFVLKCNHGCGFNIICHNKNNIDIEDTKNKLNRWLKIDYGKVSNEYHYSKIKPLIIAETYLEQVDKGTMVDYKLYCINGNPICFLVCREREIGKVKFSSYSPTWDRLNYFDNEDPITIQAPNCLGELIKYSEILSQDFPFVRLDYYILNHYQNYLGEFTFTPYGNTIEYYKDSFLLEYGKLLKLPSIKD